MQSTSSRASTSQQNMSSFSSVTLKMLLTFDQGLNPMGDSATRLSTRAGEIIGSHVPINFTEWRLVPDNFKDDVLEALLVPVYIAEITPKNLRGAFATVNQLMICIGASLTFLFGTMVKWSSTNRYILHIFKHLWLDHYLRSKAGTKNNGSHTGRNTSLYESILGGEIFRRKTVFGILDVWKFACLRDLQIPPIRQQVSF